MNRAVQYAGLVCGGFFLSFAGIYFAVPADRAALDRLASNWADDLSTSHRSRHATDRLREALKLNFLFAKDWEATLAEVSRADLERVPEEQLPEFWKTKPLGPSAAYRLFGALGRHDPAAALSHAFEVFGGKEIDGETGQACLRWAVMGIYENSQAPPIELHLSRCPQELWRGLIQGAIGGSDAGNVGDDMSRFKALLTRLLDPETNKENKPRFDELQRSVLDAWIERNPVAVIEWLQTPQAKPFEGFLSRAIAAATFGQPEEIVRLMTNPRTNLKMVVFAAACYRSGADAATIEALMNKLPVAKRREFLAEYAQAVKEGSPRTLVDFVEAALPDLLTADTAKRLGLGILNFAPRLFEKLSAQMTPQERNKLLDDLYTESAQTSEISVLYLQHRGTMAHASNWAISGLAATDFQKALAFAATAPKDQQARLTGYIYSTRAYHLVEEGAPLDDLLDLTKAVPPEMTEDVREEVMDDLARKDPSRCLEALETRFSKDAKIWQRLFLGGNGLGSGCLNAEQMNNFLQQAIKKGIDPEVYSVAAQGLVMQFATQDLGDARATVEALPDPKAKQACTATLVKAWARTNPFEAVAYIENLTDANRRDAAIGALLPALKFAPDKREELLAIASSDGVRQSLRAQMDSPPSKSTP